MFPLTVLTWIVPVFCIQLLQEFLPEEHLNYKSTSPAIEASADTLFVEDVRLISSCKARRPAGEIKDVPDAWELPPVALKVIPAGPA